MDHDILGLPFRFAAELKYDPKHFVVIGGAARAGTSTCERYIHELPRFFVADEFLGCSDRQYLSGIEFSYNYNRTDSNIEPDKDGKGWRGLSEDDLTWRSRRLLLTTLLCYTRASKFASKDPNSIEVFGLKLPGIENSFLSFANYFSEAPLSFIYCVRDPLDILRSRWSMPWTGDIDQNAFAARVAEELDNSMSSFGEISARGYPVAIWKTPQSAGNVPCLLQQLGLEQYLDGVVFKVVPTVDEWPVRRRVEPLSREIIRVFESREEVAMYRDRFQLQARFEN